METGRISIRDARNEYTSRTDLDPFVSSSIGSDSDDELRRESSLKTERVSVRAKSSKELIVREREEFISW